MQIHTRTLDFKKKTILHSLYVYIVLASNTQIKKMHSTSLMRWKQNTLCQRNGKEKSIVVWPSIGTTNNKQSQSPSQITFQNISTNSNIKFLKKQEMPHNLLQGSNTAQELNKVKNKTKSQSYRQRIGKGQKNSRNCRNLFILCSISWCYHNDSNK